MNACSHDLIGLDVSNKQVTIYLSSELRQALRATAFAFEKSASQLVSEALEAYLSDQSVPKPGRRAQKSVATDNRSTAPPPSEVEKTLAEHTAAIEGMKAALASLEAKVTPRPLDMPKGECSQDETIILEMVRAGGKKGATPAAIEERFKELGIGYVPRRNALSSLQKRGVLWRTRASWVLAS